MNVRELTRDQIIQLKQTMLTDRLLENNEEPSYGELLEADSTISDEEVFKEFADTEFTSDDFLCSAESEDAPKPFVSTDIETKGFRFESEQLWRASPMHHPADAWSELSAAFTPSTVSQMTFPDEDIEVFTADYFKSRIDRTEHLADVLKQTGEAELMKCAEEVHKWLAPYKEALANYTR